MKRAAIMQMGWLGGVLGLWIACAEQVQNLGDEAVADAGVAGGISTGGATGSAPGQGGGIGGGILPPLLLAAGPFAEDFPPNGTQNLSEATYSNLKNPQALQQYCNGTAVETEPDKSVIEFLVDVSGSMLAATANTGGLPKWAVTRTAIKDAVQRLPPTFGVGVTFFPNMDIVSSFTPRPTSACVDSSRDVPIALATPDQVAQILSTLDAVEPFPMAATPTYEAYGVAVNQLLNTTLPGKKYVVLITDGQPTQGEGCIGSGGTCDTVTPTPVGPIIHAMDLANLDHEISTFVVGSPGSEKVVCTGEDTRPWLSESALYGATGSPGCTVAGPNFCHFDLSSVADFATALGDALKNITDTLIKCNYDVPPLPSSTQLIDAATTSMLYSTGTGEFLLLLPNRGGCALGWSFADKTNSVVQICGPTCDVLQNNPAAKLTILFGCASTVIPTIQ